MNRCLHITIHEGSAAAPRPANLIKDRKDYKDRTSTDPEDRVHVPRVDDPASDYVLPRPDDPSALPYLSGISGGCGDVAATACSCATPATQDTAAPGKTTPHPFIRPQDYSGFVIVRMAEGIESEAQTLWELAEDHKPKLKGLQDVLELPVKPKTDGQIPEEQPAKPPEGTLAARPLVELHRPFVVSHGCVEAAKTPLSRSEVLNLIHDLETRTAKTPFPPLHSLASYWRLDLREHSDLVEKVVAQLNGLAEVGLAYRELAATDPQGAANGWVFSEDQGYLDDAPTGISGSWARERLAAMRLETTGGADEKPSKPLTLCDLEQGWNLDHQALKGLVDGPLFGVNRAQGSNGHSGHHGTAVLGQLAADGKNVQGIATDIARFVVASHYNDKEDANGNVAAAILQALSPMASPSPAQLGLSQPGDILLIEVQRGLLPAEVEEEDFNAIRLAAGLGIIVIEAAGNGGFDLDAYSNPSAGRSLRRDDLLFRDSGAILVGASRASLPHDRATFSNYGSRLDCFGWGEAVTTCGYGNLAVTEAKDSYTNTFSGTSSASAIIAGAAALLQSLHETQAGVLLGPQAMRELLADPTTGTRQGPNVAGHIGVMPDLKTIVQDRLQLVPNIYMRRSIGDDGAPPAPRDEISSSPDLLISSRTLGNVRSRFGAGSRGENLAAPGDPIVPPGDIYLRLRNRGLGEGTVHVQLFASPAATLITPERWLPVGSLDVSQTSQIPHAIPQGDTLVVAGPVYWASGPISAPSWSLLAILSEPEESGPSDLPYFDGTGGMPPGPPYFDWAEYRAFLRGPGVAWRNTHHDARTSPALSFFIAGTPDRARHFDFEVIQRLPAEATVTLQVPLALAAKLLQRQPWVGGGNGLLPKQPRTAIRGVELAAGMYAKAVFTVTVQPGNPRLETGHSLAIRQLWRGEEVGRITWYFGPR